MADRPSLFSELQFRKGVSVRNRIVMAPMTTWAGHPDGMVADEELAYYRRRVKGVGLVITGCTHVTENGIGFTDEFAAFDDRFVPSLSRLAAAAQSGGAPAILQLFHAGVKAIPSLIPNGLVVAPSDHTSSGVDASVHALSHDEIIEIVKAFGDATRRAIEAGFDGVELHGAHGFLLQNFVSPHFNRRTDAWGGSLEDRIRFPLAVFNEVKRVADLMGKETFVLGYRISPDEPEADGLRLAESIKLIDGLIDAGLDYLHVSLSDLLNARPVDDQEGHTTISRVLDHVSNRIPVIAAGKIEYPTQAEEAVLRGLSLVALGRALVVNPDWVELWRENSVEKIETHLQRSDAPQLEIPPKLLAAIEGRPGWFKLA